MKKILENYYHIMSLMPQDALGEEQKVDLDSLELDVIMEETNDELETWRQKSRLNFFCSPLHL